ncbi:hypothetical protein IWW38_002898, partial [Coemansia aciculifera]
MSASLSPAQRLPTDVLYQIFWYTTDKQYYKFRHGSSKYNIKGALSTCSLWRQAALDYMWGDLAVHYDPKYPQGLVSDIPTWAVNVELNAQTADMVRVLTITMSAEDIGSGLGKRLLEEYV